jgi:Domain of unknown function (DUF5060)
MLNLMAQAPSITFVRPAVNSVAQNDKFEADVGVNAVYTNPFDYGQIAVSATLRSPSGRVQVIDGFFAQDFRFANMAGSIAAVGSGGFKLRFAPTETGIWAYTVRCTTPTGMAQSEVQTFLCTTAATVHSRRGWVRSGGSSNYFHFDNGDPFVPVGLNICWPGFQNAFSDYSRWLGKLEANGGNFFRLWLCHWGLGLEWRGSSYEGLGRYRQDQAFYLDWLFDYCAARGIGVQWCLQHHGQVSTKVNSNWSESPYNATNGGPCVSTRDFFTNPTARTHTLNLYRYIVARWGYARSIAAWELFNEVDWTDDFQAILPEVRAWHAEMGAFFKKNDPNLRLVTTSFAEERFDAPTWNGIDIDFTQTHHYVNTPHLERILNNSADQYLNAYDKPTLHGEFGLAANALVSSSRDPGGIHLHNVLWGSLFSGATGTAMSWWWDNYVEPRNLYAHFGPVAAMSQRIPFHRGRYVSAATLVRGAPGDLSLVPSAGWGGFSEVLLRISTAGVQPANAVLGQFLYGSQWNTTLRRPPTFQVGMPQAGSFQIKTGAETGQSPRLAVWIDDQLVFTQDAAINQLYTIRVNAGQHSIRVDNTGTDWISIASYTFSGLGSLVDAYVLRSDKADQAAGWVLHNRYNHEYLLQSGKPPAVIGATLSINDMENGPYTVQWFDCLTGDLRLSTTSAAENGQLSIAIPELHWDLAFKAEAGGAVSTDMPTVRASDIRIAPNPVLSGAAITLFMAEPPNKPVQIDLLDGAGRVVSRLFDGALTDNKSLSVPAGLAAGVYYLKMTCGGRDVATVGLFVL